MNHRNFIILQGIFGKYDIWLKSGLLVLHSGPDSNQTLIKPCKHIILSMWMTIQWSCLVYLHYIVNCTILQTTSAYSTTSHIQSPAPKVQNNYDHEEQYSKLHQPQVSYLQFQHNNKSPACYKLLNINIPCFTKFLC